MHGATLFGAGVDIAARTSQGPSMYIVSAGVAAVCPLAGSRQSQSAAAKTPARTAEAPPAMPAPLWRSTWASSSRRTRCSPATGQDGHIPGQRLQGARLETAAHDAQKLSTISRRQTRPASSDARAARSAALADARRPGSWTWPGSMPSKGNASATTASCSDTTR